MSISRIENSGSFHGAGTQVVGNSFNTHGGHVHFHAATTVGDTEESSSVPTHVHWLVTRSANPLFTGRAALLQDLEKTIRNQINSPERYTPCQIVILGIGGQGKSEICLQLARCLRSVFWAVLWVDVSTRDIAERSFMEVARKLLIPAQEWEDARHGIANLAHPWLLVLDNADRPDVDYQEYFPEGALGTVIMTTRNEECQQYGTDLTITLTGLEISEARDLLLKATRIPPNLHSTHDRDAIAVAELLQSHPLALIQAGAYISQGHCTMAEYPRLYERQRQRLLTFRPRQARSRYGDVYATFEVSAATLAATGTQAARDTLDLLPLLAVCGPNHLPIALFETAWQGAKQVPPDLNNQAEDQNVMLLTPWHTAHLPAFIGVIDAVWDSFRLTEAIALLKAFSLVLSTSLYGAPAVSVHPLVHAWARDRQDEDQQQQTWLQMGCVVALALRGGTLLPGDQRLLQSHVEALVDWDAARIFSHQPPTLVARILVNCGWSLNEWRADSKLYTLLERLLTHLKMDRLRVDWLWIGLYGLTARNASNYGKVKEAVALLEQVVQIREQTLAVDHPERLGSQHALAMAYRDNGQVKEAVALLEQVVQIREQTLAVDHPSRLGSQHALAIAYQDNGQVKEAVALLEQVVQIKEQTLAVDHPSRLASQYALAMAYRDNRQVKEAVALLEQVVQIEEQTLAADHPSRLASQQVLATVLWESKECYVAYEIMRQVVEHMRRKFDKGHPDRNNAEVWLAVMEHKLTSEG